MGRYPPIGSIFLSLESAVVVALIDQMHVSQSYPLPVMFQLVCHRLMMALRFLHPPIPHTHQPSLRLACLPDIAGQAGGRDCHVPRIASIPRLGSIFPPTVFVVPQHMPQLC